MRVLDAIAVSALSRVEVAAALWRKQRMGELTSAEAGVLAQAVEADFHGAAETGGRFAVTEAGAGILDQAAGLVGTASLRAYDAVQLATAIAARSADRHCATFACFDSDLRRAAAASGFTLLP